eukprot:gnl/MRDRNA2_/MRDRNA2_100566_c0_seq1.p1 gnl/MRDRNA2_/MRDRNA2_100566_c0~~gnl/MRDRNA2_/MRDRNA2_100566_c0_seq1.p1  ORF type:complete len:239 (+),score=39.72 gnl/MRDRNA2_/MRDRNA2_100566_c0_seq1:120-836(+)
MPSSSQVRGENIDAVRFNAGHHEWIERDRLRKLGQLQQGQILQSSSQNKPWAPLGERPDGGSWTSLGDRTPDRSRSTTAASRSERSPATSAGRSIVSQRLHTSSRPQSQASKSPSTAGSRPISGQVPPLTGMTQSTTLSQMYRRAVSTPALRTSQPELGRKKNEETGLGGGMGGRSSEPWYCEHPKMNTSDLVKIVEHLHDKVLRERRRRVKAQQAAEASAMMSDTWQSGSGAAASRD